MNKQARLRRIAAIVLLLLACFFGIRLLMYWQENRTAARDFEKLSQAFHEQAEQEEESDGPVLNEAIQALQEQNGDCVGWISVKDTKIDYPLMHTPAQPEKYLRKNFEQDYSTAGTPFVDGRCSLESDNLILYGHNMQTGAMFADLLQYNKQEFFEAHDSITLTLLYETRTYEVIAAFPSEVHVDRNDFPWFDYLSFTNEAEFADFVSQLRAESLYPLAAEPEYGDKFITLATCSYHDSSGRFVLIGREISDGGL